MIADKPTMAPTICTMQPVIIPSDERIPALLPCDVLLAATYNISLPGVKLSSKAVKANTQKFSMPIIYLLKLQIQRSEEHTSELQSRRDLVCRLLLEKKK